MIGITFIFLSFLAIFLLTIYVWYTNIIANRNGARQALSGIDVQLRKRADLLPNVLKIAKKFMDHEQSLLSDITTLRTQILKGYDQSDSNAIQDHLNTAEKLNGKMGQLLVTVENYPDLKSDTAMIKAQQTYNEVEQEIAAARRFYNLILPANGGHPVKQVHYTTEVNHEKTIRNEKGIPETLFAGLQGRSAGLG